MENIGLLSLDLGSVFSPDGREHAIIGTTPVQELFAPNSPSDDCSRFAVGSFDYQKCMLLNDPITKGSTVDPKTGNTTSGITWSDLFSPNLGDVGKIILARIALVILGILLIVVVGFRLTSSR